MPATRLPKCNYFVQELIKFVVSQYGTCQPAGAHNFLLVLYTLSHYDGQVQSTTEAL